MADDGKAAPKLSLVAVEDPRPCMFGFAELCKQCQVKVDTLADVRTRLDGVDKAKNQQLLDGVDPLSDAISDFKALISRLNGQIMFYKNSFGEHPAEDISHAINVSIYIYTIKEVLEDEKVPDAKKLLICNTFVQLELVSGLILHMPYLPSHEVKKACTAVFQYMLRKSPEPVVAWFQQHTDLMSFLVHGYKDDRISLVCGPILRQCVRKEPLAEWLLNSDIWEMFFDLVQLKSFEVSSDAFSTFSMMLTKHKPLAAKFLEAHQVRLFEKWLVLLVSRNYVVKRQSIAVLVDLIMERSNFKFMMAFVSNSDNLKVCMNLLMGHSKQVQTATFDLFKIFILNPKKTQPIKDLLIANRAPLLAVLKDMQDRDEEKQMKELPKLLTLLESLE